MGDNHLSADGLSMPLSLANQIKEGGNAGEVSEKHVHFMYWYCMVTKRLWEKLWFSSLHLCLCIFALGKLMFFNFM